MSSGNGCLDAEAARQVYQLLIDQVMTTVKASSSNTTENSFDALLTRTYHKINRKTVY